MIRYDILDEYSSSIDKLANASREELLSIPGVGPKVVDSILAFFRQEANRDTIVRLRKAGVKMSGNT